MLDQNDYVLVVLFIILDFRNLFLKDVQKNICIFPEWNNIFQNASRLEFLKLLPRKYIKVMELQELRFKVIWILFKGEQLIWITQNSK